MSIQLGPPPTLSPCDYKLQAGMKLTEIWTKWFNVLFQYLSSFPVSSLVNTISPVTASTYSVNTTDATIVVNHAGISTLTFPLASVYMGRSILIKTVTANTVVSATANIIPLIGGSASTAILAGTAGKWAIVQSDGKSWQIMASN